jgi:HAD superfamily hydrolase (TIGR01509 family)
MSEPTNGPGSVQAVIFDLDGVLMNSEWLAYLVWREYVEQKGGRLDESAHPSMIGLTAEATAEYVMRQTGITFDVTEGCAWIWNRTIERLKTEIDPLPGAADLVRALAERGVPLAIASNSPGYYIDASLKGLGLETYFPVRSAVDQVPNGKPAPDIYLRAAELLGIAPQHCLAVEDSQVGLQSATAAGIRVAAVPAPHDRLDGFQGAWKIYNSLVQLCEEVDALLAQPG